MNVPLLERGTHVLKLPFHHVDQNSLQIVCEFPHSQEEFPTKICADLFVRAWSAILASKVPVAATK
jgi:hypothetical protein